MEVRPGGPPAGGVGLNPNPFGAGLLNAGGSGGKSAAAWYIEGIEKAVTLTPQQKEAMAKILEARDKEMQEFQTKNGDKLKAAMKAMTDAYQGKDKEAITRAQKEYQEANAGTSQIFKQAQTALDGVLTDEQKAKRQELMTAQTIKAMTDPAVLTGEQTAQIKSLLAKGNPGGEREGSERGERQWYQSIQDVLTAEQKATIARHRALSYTKAVYGRVNLTADQWQKIEAAYDELAKTPNLSGEAVTKELSEKVKGLLTQEQKEGMKNGVWSTATVGAAPGQAAQKSPGASRVVNLGEGAASISVSVTGEPGNAAGGFGQTFVIGEGRMEMEKGPWLGIGMEPVSEPLRAQLSLARSEGLVIDHVVPNSPAAGAGLAQYDVLLRLDDQILVEQSQLKKLIGMKKPGDRVKLVYVRKAERKETTATLAEHEIESFERAPLGWSQMAPGQSLRPAPGNYESRERQEPQIRQMKEKNPGAPQQPGPVLKEKPQGARGDESPQSPGKKSGDSPQ